MSQGWVPIDRRSMRRAGYTNQPYIDQSENSCSARPIQPLMMYNPRDDMYSAEPNSRQACWKVPFDAGRSSVAPPSRSLY